jgi:2-dehydro-3-deoxygluconokinase
VTVVCFGELLLRLGAPGRELLLQSPRLEVHVGGAEANVAIGLAALAHPARMIGLVPDNALGRAAAAELRRQGVDTGTVAFGPGRMGLYFLSPGAGARAASIDYDREASSFALAGPGDYDWKALLEGASHLHLSGITPALGDGPARAAIDAAEAAGRMGIRVSFDGNYRTQLWERRAVDPAPVLRELVSRADIFFGNERDMALLLSEEVDAGRPAAEAAFRAFPKLSLLASTSRTVEDAERHRIRARLDARDEEAETGELEVSGIVDRIGTGDAFAAGVLHALRLGEPLARAAEAGLALCALKHTLPGDASLFSRDDLEAFMRGASDVRR